MPYIRTHEIAKSETPKGQKVLIEASLLLKISGFIILVVVKTRAQDSLFWNSRSHEMRYSYVGGWVKNFGKIDILGFGRWKG